MAEPSVYVMRRWLRDVVEVEKGILVVDAAITDLQSRKKTLMKKLEMRGMLKANNSKLECQIMEM